MDQIKKEAITKVIAFLRKRGCNVYIGFPERFKKSQVISDSNFRDYNHS